MVRDEQPARSGSHPSPTQHNSLYSRKDFAFGRVSTLSSFFTRRSRLPQPTYGSQGRVCSQSTEILPKCVHFYSDFSPGSVIMNRFEIFRTAKFSTRKVVPFPDVVRGSLSNGRRQMTPSEGGGIFLRDFISDVWLFVRHLLAVK